MPHYIKLLLFSINFNCFCDSYAQSQLVDIQFDTPSLPTDESSLKVYLPPDYNQDNNDQYGMIIFLHGSGNSSPSNIARPVREAMDEMIQRSLDFPSNLNPTDFKVRSMIVVFPSLKATFTDKPTYSSAHQYENSQYFGNYEDVIVNDLIQSLHKENDYNLKNKINFSRETMGIAGFSSGGDGALRIGIKHRDKFIAIGAHAAYASLRQRSAWNPILEQYRAGTSLFVDEINGLSAVWIGLNDNQEPDLLVDRRGSIIPEKLDIMRNNAGIIQNYFNLDEDSQQLFNYINLADSEDVNKPYIYADCGNQDIWLKEFNEDFINYMNVVYPDYFRGSIINDVSHQLSTVNVKRSLDFIDSKMASTTPVFNLEESQTLKDIQLKPNPVSNNQFELMLNLDIPQLFNIYLISESGEINQLPSQSLSAVENTIIIRLDGITNGHYTLLMHTEDFKISQKLVIMR